MSVTRKPGGPPPSPVRGELARQAEVPVSAADQQALAKLRKVPASDIDELQSAARRAEPLLAPAAHLGAPVEHAFRSVVQGLAAIYEDGRVVEGEVAALNRALKAISRVLNLDDPQVMGRLPAGVADRLREQLIAPLQTLRMTGLGQLNGVMGQVDARDRAALHVRLGAAVEYRPLRMDELLTVDGAERYLPGDRVAVRRSSGELSLGVVTGRDPDGLRVEVLAGGQVGLRTLSDEEVLAENPLKIGDYLPDARGQAGWDFATGQPKKGMEVWVTGVDDRGQFTGVARDGERTVALGPNQLRRIAERLNGELEASRAPSVAPPPPAVPTAPAQVVMRAGNVESNGVEGVRGQSAQGALFTSKGIDYADYNEDAALLEVIPSARGRAEAIVAGAFDQAGGMGKLPEQGMASRVAAEHFQTAARKIAAGEVSPQEGLRQGFLAAHEAVHGLNVQAQMAHKPAVTTIAAGVIQAGKAYLANTGDSQVLLYDSSGRLKAQTETHNYADVLAKATGDPNAGLHMANIIMSSVGGAEPPQVDLSEWPVTAGDYLVFISDGVCDANLPAQKRALKEGRPWTQSNSEVTARALGQLLSGATSAEDATRLVSSYALDQMKAGHGKADNIAAVVVQVR
jgi:serine/threonine protein phosphatase PrpC